ncbi:LPXTG cell wall anchor domain-containing protein [Sphingorhabdus sp. M41]|uniref:LPXTG cell wall anchor domain-containing protein n=1 Tax=Sphingorhabdus sp. M41 TaxID=1806885 RepID=UPI00078BF0E9|nr:LPXTG cell wall anchor domain-containing protein [Sphingorhabdus sp. M41]AMO70904.1 hypothetical protein AZE99_02685 [Sphingorhabdus sp. M41]
MSSPLLHSSPVQRVGRHSDLKQCREIAVFQTIRHIGFHALLTGAALGLSPSSVAMAQSAIDEPLPVLQSQPSVDSYSLPPGPSSTPAKKVLQGPVDADIPLAEPTIVTPRTSPAKPPTPLSTSPSASPAIKPAAIDRRADQPPSTIEPTRRRPDAQVEKPASETGSAPAEPAINTDDGPESTTTPADIFSSPTATLTEPLPETETSDWQLLVLGLLLFVLLGALFLWRARRHAAPKQTTVTDPERATAGLPSDIATLPDPILPVAALSIGFQPHSANATLINAVLGFELTLSNHGGDDLTGIRVSGAMVQAQNHGAGDPVLADLSPLAEVPNLPTGETEKIVAEFRIPLTGIRPIQFQSQALFVPLVQIAIEFTDVSGTQHIQTAAYLVGQEHQPLRPKMAPFRLDLGPRSFAPLGHRPLAMN